MTDELQDLKDLAEKAGLPPGTLVHVGEPPTETPQITVMAYSDGQLEERRSANLDGVFPLRDEPWVTWVDLAGLRDVKALEQIGRCLSLHPLVMEDILNTTEMPKLDDLGGYLYIVLKSLYFDPQLQEVTREQISLILGPNYVLSFQESIGDNLESVRERLRAGRGRLRGEKADYLLYSILDRIVDDYFVALEQLGDRLEGVEDELVERPGSHSLHAIYALKREMIVMRRAVWPLREVLSSLQRSHSSLVRPSTAIYLRDLFDHTMHVLETVEIFRDMLSGMLDIYLSSMSNRLNEVMKVLTMVGTIFIPLTFLAGVYGMNFRFFPEIGWRWGYLFFWLLCLLVAAGMMVFFRRRKWL
jgi:magnesium transporter